MKKLPDPQAFQLLKKAGIPLPKQLFTLNLREAENFAEKIGYPCIIKLSSPQLVHKTEGGWVKQVASQEELKKEFRRMLKARFRQKAILVQERLKGIELLAGLKRDEQFGPVLVFGLGGVWVEVLKDISMRLIPVTRKDIQEMISETKCFRLLKGFRGFKADLKKLEDCLLKLSSLAKKEKILELDINPLFANQKGVWAADVRIIYKG
ncbi:MAG: hypothetical protein DRP12_00375 [Candidatus Aenigmatarchaeota archaeon]|nr:MAG: hypothetical protein DRP12_00375 [Candidatus Aenigmarchaeota archaeon]